MTTIKSKLYTKDKGVRDYSFTLVYDTHQGYSWQVNIEYDNPLTFFMQLDPVDNRIKITEPMRTILPKSYPSLYEMETIIAEKIIEETINL